MKQAPPNPEASARVMNSQNDTEMSNQEAPLDQQQESSVADAGKENQPPILGFGGENSDSS